MLYVGYKDLTIQEIIDIFNIDYYDNVSWSEYYYIIKTTLINLKLNFKYFDDDGTFCFGILCDKFNEGGVSVDNLYEYISEIELILKQIIQNNNIKIKKMPTVFDM